MTSLPPVPEALTTVALAAEMVRVDEQTIRDAIADGRLQTDADDRVDMRDVVFHWNPDREIP